MTRVLVTGGAGFAGFHICEHLLHSTDWEVIVLDRLSYAGSLERLHETKETFGTRLRFVFHDFRAAFPASVLKALDDVQFVIHNGAESHVERSLKDPEPFVTSNVLGTMHVLNACRQLDVDRIIQVSTDEVYGPAEDGYSHVESDPYRPSNPYSASKAGADALAYAYWKSFRLPVTRTNTMNLFGEKQHSEKFVSMSVGKILTGEQVTIHGTTDGRIGSRKWLHARNQADALLFLLRSKAGIEGETFHIAGEERTNLEIASLIARVLGKPLSYQVVDFHASRPGHDLRYSLDDSKLRGRGWTPPVNFEDSLVRTVEWMSRPENAMWLEGEKCER